MQTVLVVILFVLATAYLITKFIWKPAFLSGGKNKSSCGNDNCGCH